MAHPVKEFLERTPFFGGLVEAHLERVTNLLTELDYAAGAVVLREGEPGNTMYIVGSGELLVTQSGESGREVRLTRLWPGDIIGETGLIEMQPMQFTVRAEEPSRLYALTASDLYKLYREDVSAYVMVLQNINRELCRRLRKRDERITEVADEFGDDRTQIRPGVGKIRRRTDF